MYDRLALHSPLGGQLVALKIKKAYLTLLRSVLVNVTDTFLFVFAVMPFARSVVLHFPAEIHRTQAVSAVAPQLLQALDVEKVRSCCPVPEERSSPRYMQDCPSTGTMSLRDPLSSLETSLFLSPPLTSQFVPCLFVTCLSKFLIVM